MSDTVVEIQGAGAGGTVLKCARVRDGLSRITEISAEVAAESAIVDLNRTVGAPMRVVVKASDGSFSAIGGTCVAASYLGTSHGAAAYALEIRPWLWFLTRTRETRIFQNKSALDIIKEIIGDYGHSGNITDKTTHSFSSRIYCVQYRETDFDFVSRLMEQEGIYYFFDHSDTTEKLVLCDGSGAHAAIPGHAKVEFNEPEDDALNWQDDHIRSWQLGTRITTGQVTLDGYGFEAPRADISAVNQIKKGSWTHNDREHYDWPGRYTDSGVGTHFARVRMESLAIRHQVWSGLGNVRGIATGATFTLSGFAREAENQEYLVTGCTHYLLNEQGYKSDEDLEAFQPDLLYPNVENPEAYICEIEAVPKSEPFRAPQITPWPTVSGVHTALVVGKSGEEIWTDKYGRVRVQFHWDRDGKKDDTAACWVRVATPWSGKNWGMIHVPRIGQEVVVDFEEGDPDRPLITGMLWNADNMPPYPLPANQTMQGIKTNKSKGGGGFNELVFEDKAAAEYVRLQSERDYTEIIKNNAEITIGMEHKDKGNLTQTVYNDFTETIKVGDHKSTIEKGDETIDIKTGSQKITIKKDQTETISGKSTRTVTGDVKETYKAKLTQDITGNVTQTVKQGNYSQEIKMGNFSHKVGMGSVKQEVKMGSVSRKVTMGSIKDTISLGNVTTKASLGKITQQAMQAIELKVGSNSLKIDMTGVTIKGAMVKVEGTAMVDVKAPIVQIKGDGMLKAEAPMVQIEGKALGMFKAPLTMVDGSALAMVKGGIAMVN